MNEPTRYASPEYPVLYSVGDAPLENGMLPVSLALLVGGIPSFIGTVPVEAPLLQGLVASLDAGAVRVVVEGVRIGEDEILEEAGDEERDEAKHEAGGGGEDKEEAWRTSIPPVPPLDSSAQDEDASSETRRSASHRGFPAALLSLACSDGRRVGVARIVSRDPKGDPGSVARFVHRQITRGVQIPDLAQAN